MELRPAQRPYATEPSFTKPLALASVFKKGEGLKLQFAIIPI